VRVGSVLNEALDLYQRFFWRFVATAAVVFVFLDLITAIGSSAGSDAGMVLWGLIGVVLSIVGTFWVQGALTEAVSDVRDGRIDTTIGELYSRTRPRLPALIVAGILAALGIVLGLVLLIVPGLYLLSRWAVITPAIVLEKRSAGESFARSSELTAGNRLKVLGVVVVTLVILIIGSAIVRSVLQALLPDFLGAWLGSVIVDCLGVPFAALAWTVMYFRLAHPDTLAQPQASEPLTP
jgi:hypothetical protein